MIDEGPFLTGEACCLTNCFLSSTISLSISAFLLRLPTRLKFVSILHSSFRRRHRLQTENGSWTTSHRSYGFDVRVSMGNEGYELNSLLSHIRQQPISQVKQSRTFCWRHSLQALLTGCRRRSSCPSWPSSPSTSSMLPGELSRPASEELRLRSPPPALDAVGLVRGALPAPTPLAPPTTAATLGAVASDCWIADSERGGGRCKAK